MRRYPIVSGVMLFVLILSSICLAETVTLEVRPGGEMPTVVAARDAIRAKREQGQWLDGPINVVVHQATYLLDEPLVFGPQDGGSPDAPVTYIAQGTARPTISGGIVLTQWRTVTVDGKKLWAADLPALPDGKTGWNFRQLFVRGERRPRTRLPDEGFYTFSGLPEMPAGTKWNIGQTQASYRDDNLNAQWRNPEDIDIVALHFWIESRLSIKAIEPDSKVVTFDGPSTFRLTEAHDPNQLARYYVENVFEALDKAGEWYLDRKQSTLYYMPMPAEKIEGFRAVVPRLDHLVRVEGTADNPVTDLRFEGLNFSHSEWYWPEGDAGSVQAAFEVPAAFQFVHARRCELHRCVVGHVANYGVEVGPGCGDTKIVDCAITDLGAGGVKVQHFTRNTVIHNSVISNGGNIFHSGIGVWIGQSSDNHVTHNDIHHFYYTGVSIGWRWGYGENDGARNIIANNHIHHIGQHLLSDMGGIYTLGVSPGTKLKGNLIHDVYGFKYGGWGLYNDEGSSFVELTDNVVYRTSHAGYHQHYGRDNHIYNNVFAFGKYAQIMRTREESHNSFTFERNIVYFDEGPLLGSNWSNDKFTFDRNVYWQAKGEPFNFAGESLAQWQARGHDIHSVIADPKFVNVEKDDFRLRRSSPAYKLGFKPIDMSNVGVMRK